jgi:uncharacterized protein involved in cysteine biosynthesis
MNKESVKAIASVLIYSMVASLLIILLITIINAPIIIAALVVVSAVMLAIEYAEMACQKDTE